MSYLFHAFDLMGRERLGESLGWQLLHCHMAVLAVKLSQNCKKKQLKKIFYLFITNVYEALISFSVNIRRLLTLLRCFFVTARYNSV